MDLILWHLAEAFVCSGVLPNFFGAVEQSMAPFFMGRRFSRDDEGTIQIRVEAGCYGEAQGSNAGAPTETDRALLLADAEWLEDLDHARGVRAALRNPAARHFQRRTIHA